MEWIKNWVVSICSAVIFITAVELIIPDNKMDRYVKFAMGLILIAVIMNPIIKVLSNKWDMTTYINKANNYMDSKSLDNNITKYKQADKANTLNTFETNLENTSNKMLKEKFPDNDYSVKVDASYSSQNGDLVIRDLKVDVTNKGIQKVQKVDINTQTASNNTVGSANDKTALEIKNYLNQELKVDKSNIYVNEYNK
ncbi:stage III sporulation protein AF [Clostridium akagii]|uniref:stage III sporulation protein AF n=1 Tax=Clostridium akagii TaxID=91623 RepID=UPI00047BA24E|nr:stage III sporulation protein AF [Clostridium akagii]